MHDRIVAECLDYRERHGHDLRYASNAPPVCRFGARLRKVWEAGLWFRCVSRLRTSAGPFSVAQAARPKIRCTKARWAEMSLAGAARI